MKNTRASRILLQLLWFLYYINRIFHSPHNFHMCKICECYKCINHIKLIRGNKTIKRNSLYLTRSDKKLTKISEDLQVNNYWIRKTTLPTDGCLIKTFCHQFYKYPYIIIKLDIKILIHFVLDIFFVNIWS